MRKAGVFMFLSISVPSKGIFIINKAKRFPSGEVTGDWVKKHEASNRNKLHKEDSLSLMNSLHPGDVNSAKKL